MNTEWPTIAVGDALEKFPVDRSKQVPSAQFQETGRFPIVDQGQPFIAGYSDDESRVIKNNLPVIIFGDHTRCFKFVDFPFILGADGTKVLKPKRELFVPKFFYYALLNLDIANRGYNRHFTLLREKLVPRPERDEQEKIVKIMDVLEDSINVTIAKKIRLEELAKVLLRKAMGGNIALDDLELDNVPDVS
jgi:type I restriction enzyme, S subunit